MEVDLSLNKFLLIAIFLIFICLFIDLNYDMQVNYLTSKNHIEILAFYELIRNNLISLFSSCVTFTSIAISFLIFFISNSKEKILALELNMIYQILGYYKMFKLMILVICVLFPFIFIVACSNFTFTTILLSCLYIFIIYKAAKSMLIFFDYKEQTSLIESLIISELKSNSISILEKYVIMMEIDDNNDFFQVYKDILNSKEFQNLSSDSHRFFVRESIRLFRSKYIDISTNKVYFHAKILKMFTKSRLDSYSYAIIIHNYLFNYGLDLCASMLEISKVITDIEKPKILSFSCIIIFLNLDVKFKMNPILGVFRNYTFGKNDLTQFPVNEYLDFLKKEEYADMKKANEAWDILVRLRGDLNNVKFNDILRKVSGEKCQML